MNLGAKKEVATYNEILDLDIKFIDIKKFNLKLLGIATDENVIFSKYGN